MTIAITTVTGTELHVTYPRQTQAQPCYVELDARDDGRLSAAANPEIGNAVPFDVVHGHVQRWTIPALKADVANELLKEIAPLAERVVAGYESTWSGSNHVAAFDEDATVAIEAIGDLCDRAGGEDEALSVWEAADWFSGLGGAVAQAHDLGITAETTDEQLAEIAKRETASARADSVDELSGIEEHLRWVRKTMIDEAA